MSVIRPIKPRPGWELIPNTFAEDLSLSEDAIAVGLWLACKPEGWEVRPTAIQSAFSKRPGKPRGREWWARVAAELKAGGYLRLSRVHGKAGKFASSWTFCVFGLDDHMPERGSAVAGSASNGQTVPGQHCISNQYPRETKQIEPPPPIVEKAGETSLVVGIEQINALIEAAVWATSKAGPIKNEAGFRHSVRARISSAGPNAEDLRALHEWRTHQGAIAAEQNQAERKARELQVQTVKLAQKAARTAELETQFESLDTITRDQVLAAFSEHLSQTSRTVSQFFRRDGLKSRVVRTEFVEYLSTIFTPTNERAD